MKNVSDTSILTYKVTESIGNKNNMHVSYGQIYNHYSGVLGITTEKLTNQQVCYLSKSQ